MLKVQKKPGDRLGLILRVKEDYVLFKGLQETGVIAKLESQPGALGLRDGDAVVRVNDKEMNGASMSDEFKHAEDFTLTIVQSNRLIERLANQI